MRDRLPRRRILQYIMVIGLSGLAGCSGNSPDSSGGDETTIPSSDDPLTTTTESTPTSSEESTPPPSEASVSYPTGFGESGFTDKRTALRGHLQNLRETSFTSKTELSDGHTIIIKGNPDTGRVSKVSRKNGSVDGTFFFEGGTAEAEGIFYSDLQSYDRAITYDGQYELLLRANLTNPRPTTENGQTHIIYDVTGESLSGKLQVTGTGLIVEYTVQGPRDVQYQVTNIGNTTVERPG